MGIFEHYSSGYFASRFLVITKQLLGVEQTAELCSKMNIFLKCEKDYNVKDVTFGVIATVDYPCFYIVSK